MELGIENIVGGEPQESRKMSNIHKVNQELARFESLLGLKKNKKQDICPDYVLSLFEKESDNLIWEIVKERK